MRGAQTRISAWRAQGTHTGTCPPRLRRTYEHIRREKEEATRVPSLQNGSCVSVTSDGQRPIAARPTVANTRSVHVPRTRHRGISRSTVARRSRPLTAGRSTICLRAAWAKKPFRRNWGASCTTSAVGTCDPKSSLDLHPKLCDRSQEGLSHSPGQLREIKQSGYVFRSGYRDLVCERPGALEQVPEAGTVPEMQAPLKKSFAQEDTRPLRMRDDALVGSRRVKRRSEVTSELWVRSLPVHAPLFGMEPAPALHAAWPGSLPRPGPKRPPAQVRGALQRSARASAARRLGCSGPEPGSARPCARPLP
jgi:hypothetical protein